MAKTEYIDERRRMVDEIHRQLVGPADGADEIISGGGKPTDRYMMGKLFPQDIDIGDDDDVEGEVDDAGNGQQGADEWTDSPIAMIYQRLPASIGISFHFRDATEIEVDVWGAHYGKARNPETKKQEWHRSSLASETEPDTVRLSFENQNSGVLDNSAIVKSVWRDMGGSYLVTVSLLNVEISEGRLKPENVLFQNGFRCRTVGGVINGYPKHLFHTLDPEEEELELRYRHCKAYAVGHGCSAKWSFAEDGSIRSVGSSFIPEYEVPDITTESRLDNDNLFELLYLSNPDTPPAELCRKLNFFLDDYQNWMGEMEEENQPIPVGFKDASARLMGRLKGSLDRMRGGVKLLESDSSVRRAFQLANLAMMMQMHHGAIARVPKDMNGADTTTPDYTDPEIFGAYKWRPFQLAFALLTLDSLTRPDSPDRDVADLIWFPTGGGKTEAYLLLAALEIFHRRLVHRERGCGTVVIKRYTLRLLTSQQFQRAATLICACEIIRRNNPVELQKSPITLGLWVGEGASPNKFTGAEGELGALQQHLAQINAQNPENPFQLQRCPWCGTRIYPLRREENDAAYGVRASETSFAFFCPTSSCLFHDTLPINVVDEHLFQHPPTFLVGTIDKFARITWDPRSRSIFGRGDADVIPPSLIIQDELHLISGPLGTVAGIYESALDVLISNGDQRPKVIAATATIRRAGDQIKQLYGRPASLFPASGLDERDSYFSSKVPISKQPGRLYIGCMGQGQTPLFSLVQVIAALSQSVLEAEIADACRDAYWTQVVYHNSRRELGKTFTLSRDDVPSRIEAISTDQSNLRDPSNVVELSGNIKGSEVPTILERLFSTEDSDDAIDILPCTNILSVGVDVKRLGLMVINGQPKTTAEYIQASSRIGRGDVPGLVVTHLSSTKPRDRSHYETFTAYHQALYRRVEPTSVTPYSLPALDRAMHAAVIALIRHGMGWDENSDAAKFDKNDPEISRLLEQMKERIRLSARACDLGAALNHFETTVNWWQDWKKHEGTLRFTAYGGKQFTPLICNFGHPKEHAKATLNSMRHIDQESQIEVWH